MKESDAKAEETEVKIPLEEAPSGLDSSHQPARITRKKGLVIYGIEDRPPWGEAALMGLQHFSLSFMGCFILPLILAGPLCFTQDRELMNQLIATVFFMCGVTTFLQCFIGTRLPILQGPSAAFIVPAFVLLQMEEPCPAALTVNSTDTERHELRDIARGRMQLLQGSIFLASLVQLLIGFTGLVGLLLRFVRPLTIAITLIMIGVPLLYMASDACGTHWGISALCIFLVILFSQFLNKYEIPLPGGKRIPVFTFFPILLAVSITWIISFILTSTGAFPDDPTQYGYKARTDLFSDSIRAAPWFWIPYPGQYGMPSVSAAGFIGMVSGVIASIVESVGDYHACALICGEPPPPVHSINRGVMMEGLGCMAAGLWGTPYGYTSYTSNISIIGLTKTASRIAVYIAAGIFAFAGILYKFSAVCSSIPDPIWGAVFACTVGMVVSIGFANLSFVKVDTSRNLFILGLGLFMGLGVPDYLQKNPGVIQTGSTMVDQIFNILLGSNMFIGGLTTCILDNIVQGTAEEKGTNWREEMSARCQDENGSVDSTVYDLPFGNDWIRRHTWTSELPISPSFLGYRFRRGQR